MATSWTLHIFYALPLSVGMLRTYYADLYVKDETYSTNSTAPGSSPWSLRSGTGRTYMRLLARHGTALLPYSPTTAVLWQHRGVALLRGEEGAREVETGRDRACPQTEIRLPERAREVQCTLKILHENGIVHVDVRWPNMIVDEESRQTKTTDFDWAGDEGAMRYPQYLAEGE